jgi:NAD(P)-dependent dehydrogenase (short-subunit alcohol dehydrogenase family)
MSKVWIVTGSSRGLGRAIVEAALEAGERVVATARDPRQLDDLATTYGDRVLPFALDVTDAAGSQAAVDAALERFGQLDVVVNNAGYATLAAVEDISLDTFREQVETNFLGVVYLTKAALPTLREQGTGHIVQISSIGGRVASAGLSAYQGSKWAVGGFSEVLAREVGPLGVRVTVLEPGGMSTDWSGSSMEVPAVSAPYAQTVGVRARQYEEGVATTSDPAKVAHVVLALTRMDDPPVRLLAGSDAVRVAAMVARARAESDARFGGLSLSTDHA